MNTDRFDIVILGGGLQSGLLVMALRALRPDSTVAVVERDPKLGGEHTWSFHRTDLESEVEEWVEPLIAHEWSGYEVRFPHSDRSLDLVYASVTSGRFHRVVSETLESHAGCELMLGEEGEMIDAGHVRLKSGRVVEAELVIDARGDRENEGRQAGYQKFLGLELELSEPHGLNRPLLMDATVDQSEGFRFFYLLPFDATRVLVEDTRFHDSPDLDRETLRGEIHRYVETRNWKVARVVREEIGVLPMPWKDETVDVASTPLRVGMRGRWFHPATGYSFPVAARLAHCVASHAEPSALRRALRSLAAEHEGQARFARRLNRLLFRWYPPHARVNIFERFYRMPAESITRFYALRTTAADRARILVGRPPAGLSIRHRFASGVS